jgi:hypothetical protein
MIDTLGALICLPLARLSPLLAGLGKPVDAIPLSHCRHQRFLTMRTDSRDLFSTTLQQQFSRMEAADMMEAVGLTEIRFSDRVPLWCALGIKR